MSNGNLRYWGLGIYGGLVALWTGLDKIALDDTVAVVLLAPIAGIIVADYAKHRADNKA
jgi:hypothetical protein|tara:strand:- start:116 stop:292 length:177 start_codon:yes stop_codon:yes gene_type:complete